jgi:hypothetical protein
MVKIAHPGIFTCGLSLGSCLKAARRGHCSRDRSSANLPVSARPSLERIEIELLVAPPARVWPYPGIAKGVAVALICSETLASEVLAPEALA